MPDPFIARDGLTLRPAQDSPADLAVLLRWLNDPRVLEFYEGRDRPHSPQMVRENFLEADPQTTACIIEWQGRAVGYLQFSFIEGEELAEYGYTPVERVIGLDMFIGEPELWGQGLGSRAVELISAFLSVKYAPDWLTLDPHANNPRALRCYEKCGFQKVKYLPAHELHEGRMEDSWLMAKPGRSQPPDAR